MFDSEDLDEVYGHFLKLFKSIYSSHFPYKMFKASKKIRKPRITPDLLEKINTKNAMYQSFVKSRDPQSLRSFKIYRNQLTKLVRTAKAEYHDKVFRDTNGRTDLVWKN